MRDVTEDDVRRILLNPFYAIEIAPVLAEPHDTMVSEDQWVAANAKLIQEIGAEAWLRELLTVLKGDFVTGPTGTASKHMPEGNRAQRRAQRRRRGSSLSELEGVTSQVSRISSAEARPMSTDDSYLIYKICPATEWHDAAAVGTYRGSVDDLRDGFIHFSTTAQLAETLRRHFAGQHDLVLVAVDPDDLGSRLRWEPSRGGDLFPHFYGELLVSLARHVSPLEVDVEGHPQRLR
jgi:uncharacterized protein (DUF952 family)